MSRIVHLALKVDDLERTTEFYQKVFGFKEMNTEKVRDHTSRHLGRDRYEEEGCSLTQIVGVLDGALGPRWQIEHQQIEFSPVERAKNFAEKRELPGGPPCVGLAARRALEVQRLRLGDQRSH